LQINKCKIILRNASCFSPPAIPDLTGKKVGFDPVGQPTHSSVGPGRVSLCDDQHILDCRHFRVQVAFRGAGSAESRSSLGSRVIVRVDNLLSSIVLQAKLCAMAKLAEHVAQAGRIDFVGEQSVRDDEPRAGRPGIYLPLNRHRRRGRDDDEIDPAPQQ
jgi:hypothetical protein